VTVRYGGLVIAPPMSLAEVVFVCFVDEAREASKLGPEASDWSSIIIKQSR